MGARWRRPFCVSVRRDPETEAAASSPATGKRICAKFGGFFPTTASNPSTPTLRCRTTEPIPAWLPRASSDPTPPPLLPSIAAEAIPLRLRRASSEPSSPKSPSRFALLKATLRLSTSRCGVCAQSVKSSGDRSAAVFTAECSHTFHFSCIAARGSLVCPVCSATWRSSPLLSSVVGGAAKTERNRRKDMNMSLEREGESKSPRAAAAATKVYDDDEPLVPSGTNRFNPIPEADDEDADDDEKRHRPVATEENLQVCVVSEAALVSAGRSHRNYVVAVKVKAPSEFRNGRAPIDLVTVLDVRGDTTTAAKLQMLKRAMRQLIASLGAGDRLSIVAFSSTAAKRLLSLHRMSRQGQRLAGQVVDRLILTAAATQGAGGGTGAGDALRKAAKVLEDRRERNPVATIMLLSDAQQADNASTRLGFGFGHVEIPIHASGPKVDEEEEEDTNPNPNPNPFMQCVLGGLLSVVMRDVTLQLIFPAGDVSSVYSCSGRAVALGGGGTVRLGDLKAGEERMLLVELRVPVDCRRSRMAVRCSYRPAAAASQEVIRCQEQPLPLPPFHRSDHSSSSSSSSSSTSSSVNVQRVRNLFVATRAVAESRRLAELGDLATAVHLLASARTLLLQSSSSISSDKHLLLSLEAEIVEIQQRRQQQPSGLMSRGLALMSTAAPDDGREALTPTSAWRAAERLAKLAIMRKSLNRVSDLHGFENARF